jgi:uncharacterized iron-regulated membrane protein
MAMARAGGAGLRGVWRNAHLWIGLGLFLVLAPLGLTGSLLIWGDGIDKLAHPARYAVTPGALAPDVYVQAASRAFGARAVPAQLKLPAATGLPVTVSGFSPAKAPPGQRPPSLTAWIDPASGRIIDVADPRQELRGVIHRIHGNLLMPQNAPVNGRLLVGWLGVFMLMSSITGLCIWWPRNNAVLRALRWTRSPSVFSNLHHMVGFWICVPLAALSLSGAWIAFPQTMHALSVPLGGRAEAAAPHERKDKPRGEQRAGERGFAPPLARPQLDATRAVEAARGADDGLDEARLISVTLPTTTAKPAWRIQFRDGGGDPVNVRVDDASGKARVQEGPATDGPGGGDPIAGFMRRLHDGSGFGPVWRTIVALAGLAPTVLGVTGAVFWLTRRKIAASRSK